MSQPAVTEYFAKKRRRACTQSAKRLKLSDADPKSSTKEVKICDPIVEEIREAKKKITRPKRSSRKTKPILNEQTKNVIEPTLTVKNTKTKPLKATVDELAKPLNLHVSPTTSESGSEKIVEVITSVTDNHDEPCTPSKRARKNTRTTEIKKRGRITPKKTNAYDFSTAQSEENISPNTNFQTKPKRTAKKKLNLLNTENGNLPSDPVAKLNSDHKLKSLEKNVEIPKTTSTSKDKLSAREQRKLSREKTAAIAEKLLSKKKESTATLKESIKGTSKLKDLQETLLKIREQKKKQQQNDKIRKHKDKMDERQKEINKADVKADLPNKREFAYQKLHSLAQELPKGLTLPYKYKNLLELFKSADTVVSMLFNRQQTTTWSMLQKSVKDMTRKNFEKGNLAQMKSVFPEAYLYRQEKGIISYDSEIKPSDYQLTLEPVLNAEECKAFGDDPKKLTSNMLVRRRHHFSLQLLNIAKDFHKKFLSSLNPPMDAPDDKLRRWHPQFALDQVPDIPLAELPLSPLETAQKCSSAKDVLEKARNKFTKKAVEALKKVADKVTPEKTKKRSSLIIEENNNTPIKQSLQAPNKETQALKGVSKTLLEKIRAKEADKKLKSMIRPDKDVERIAMLKKLPDVARASRMLFISEKKAALPFDIVCDKLTKCASGIASPDAAYQHVELLVDQMPGWMSLAKVGKTKYLKINKGREMSQVIKELENKVKIAEKS